MATTRLVVFSEEYAGKAKPKRAESEYYSLNRDAYSYQDRLDAIRHCCSCRHKFNENEIIVIKKGKHLVKRRHVRCAVQVNMLTKTEARAMLKERLANMKRDILPALRKLYFSYIK